MPLSLYYHPLSSHCHRVLIALYEMAVAFEPVFLDFGNAGQRATFQALWPTGKIPLLLDGDRVVPETAIIIEYLALHHAAREPRLLPQEAEAALEVRLMDRLVDLYVMTPMQAIVADRIRAEADRDPITVRNSQDTLAMAYGMLETRLADRTWLAGEQFSMADCTAAPSLFYASTLVLFDAAQPRLAAYYERLLQRPSVARVLEEARPYFQFYPYRERLPERFRPSDPA